MSKEAVEQSATKDSKGLVRLWRNNKRVFSIALTAMLILIVAGSLTYWYQKTGTSSQSAAGKSLGNLDTYTLAPKGGSLKMSFKKPTSLQPPANISSSITGQTVVLSDPNTHNTAQIVASTVAVKNVDFAAVTKQLADNNAKSNYRDSFKSFLQGVVYKGYNVNLGPSKVFSNQNTRVNAWQMDFTADDSALTAPQKGKLIFVMGDTANYYFVGMDRSVQWQSKQSSWQQIFDSLRIRP